MRSIAISPAPNFFSGTSVSLHQNPMLAKAATDNVAAVKAAAAKAAQAAEDIAAQAEAMTAADKEAKVAEAASDKAASSAKADVPRGGWLALHQRNPNPVFKPGSLHPMPTAWEDAEKHGFRYPAWVTEMRKQFPKDF